MTDAEKQKIVQTLEQERDYVERAINAVRQKVEGLEQAKRDLEVAGDRLSRIRAALVAVREV